MTDNTRLTLIDRTTEAINSRDPVKIEAAQNLLRTKCYQNRASWLLFLFDEVFSKTLPDKPQTVAVSEEVVCPYCKERQKNTIALRSHLGIKHKDRKTDWKGKF